MASIPEYWNGRVLVTFLYDIRRVGDGKIFRRGTIFEVLRQDGRFVNLCEVNLFKPGWFGDTVIDVWIGSEI